MPCFVTKDGINSTMNKNVIDTEYNGVAVRVYFELNKTSPSGYEFMGISTLNEYSEWEWATSDTLLWVWGEKFVETEGVDRVLQEMVGGF